jgi:hypothetical protein
VQEFLSKELARAQHLKVRQLALDVAHLLKLIIVSGIDCTSSNRPRKTVTLEQMEPKVHISMLNVCLYTQNQNQTNQPKSCWENGADIFRLSLSLNPFPQ